MRDGGSVQAFAVVPIGSGVAIVDTGVDVTMGMKGPAGDVSAERTGNEWIVTGQARVPGEMNCVADGPCDMMPPVPGGTHDVFYVDATSGAALWHASYDFAFAARVALAVENGSLHITGAGCDVVRPRPTP